MDTTLSCMHRKQRHIKYMKMEVFCNEKWSVSNTNVNRGIYVENSAFKLCKATCEEKEQASLLVTKDR
jgi:hypothetical protein